MKRLKNNMDTKLKIIKKNTAKHKKTPHLRDYEKAYKEFSWEQAEKNELEFFPDGTINAAYIAIDRHVKDERKNKTALIYNDAGGGKEIYTFEDLARETNKFANVLINHNVKKGDRVFIFLPTIPERYISFLGILKTGAIAGTMFSAFQEMALLDRLSDSRAKIVITNPVLYPRIEKIWKDLPDLEKVIIVGRGADELPESERIIYYGKEMDKAKTGYQTARMKKNDPAYMLYTSGTTGKPKGVTHSHGDILQAMLTTKYVLDVHEEDIYWCTADTGWVTGVVYGILGIWGVGGTSVIFGGKFSAENWYKILQDNKVTIWYTAPTAIRMLMGSPVSPGEFDLSSLRHLASVGEPLNPEGIWWGIEVFGLPFHDTWWQTEQGSITITNYPAVDIKPGSMGKPFPGVIAAIVDDEGKEMPAGEEGHLALKPESVYSLMKTIWGNEEKYNSYFLNGWYISGDRAYKDEDGYFWFVGRADDVIKTSGERVGPFEVESALVEHPHVVEAGVVGMPDEIRGQIIMAFIVLRQGIEESEDLKSEIAKFVKGKLAGHAYPRKIKFVPNLPKTRSGKIMRRLLKARELGVKEGDTSGLEEY